MSAALAHRFTIAECVRVYQQACTIVRGAYAQLAGAEGLLNDTFTLGGYGSISVAKHHRLSFNDPKDVLLDIRHDVWRAIVERSEIRRMMSNSRWTELQRQIEKKELPEITEESVGQMIGSFQANLRVMLEEAVEEVFDWLRPRSHGREPRYKRNSELEVPSKIVLKWITEVRDKRWSHTWRVNYRAEQNLIALENVFSALDGQGQIAKTHYSAISTVIKAEGYAGKGETPYFSFRTFENGNMHLAFRREDLLAKFNAIAGGRRLRPAP